MKNKAALLIGLLVVLLLGTGVVVYSAVFRAKPAQVVEEEMPINESLPPVEESVVVDVVPSTAKANAVVIQVSGLGGKYQSVGYELTYDSKGLIKGLDSGSIPVDVSGEDTFEKEVYLGTCSRNVCTPDPGVTTVSLVLTFEDASGTRSQFTRDFEI